MWRGQTLKVERHHPPQQLFIHFLDAGATRKIPHTIMKVYNLINDRGNRAQNQVVVELDGVLYFTSYSCPVCKIDKGEVTLHPTYWDYSRTTSKHLYIFLRSNGFCVDNKKGVERRIKSGEFKVKAFNY